jgi:hypothetical protein
VLLDSVGQHAKMTLMNVHLSNANMANVKIWLPLSIVFVVMVLKDYCARTMSMSAHQTPACMVELVLKPTLHLVSLVSAPMAGQGQSAQSTLTSVLFCHARMGVPVRTCYLILFAPALMATEVMCAALLRMNVRLVLVQTVARVRTRIWHTIVSVSQATTASIATPTLTIAFRTRVQMGPPV